jgi:hypothetical protein
MPAIHPADSHDVRLCHPLRVFAVIAAGAVVCPGAGCGSPGDIRPGDIRSYRVPRPVQAASPRTAPAPGSEDGSPRLDYELPPGWTDRGASGLRLATLAIGDPADGHEVTVIPASGTLESNVARWIGQLDEAADEATRAARAAAAIADARAIDVNGTQASVVLLVAGQDDTDSAGGQAILGAMIPVADSSSLFVKFKGDAAVARREREHFDRFVSSIRWK